MRRLAVAALVVAGLCAAVVVAGAGHGGDPTRYRIVFDNASGLVEQADFRVGGVTVGAIESFDVGRDARAVVTVRVDDEGFGGLRRDASCEILQQSLIGEYFVQCEPGQSRRTLADGGTVPVRQTRSPIAFDLVQNVMRRPYRERLSIILSELGAGFAARGEDVNQTIRRAVPALQETNRVLKILGDNRRTLRRLAADSGEILRVLGRRREDVGRFVIEARDTAATTAERRRALAATFRRFPGFLAQLSPTMRELSTTARRLTPALADLRVSAPAVESVLRTLPPFSRASVPAVESLGRAGVAGRRTAREAAGTVRALGRLGNRSAEPANNLAMILSHLDDRRFAVEPDPDSPTGKGYTGLEAILQYPFDQSLAINSFDTRGYLLKINLLVNECTEYTTDEGAREEPERYKRCAQGLGPNQPGITTPDPTETGEPSGRRRAPRAGRDRRPPRTEAPRTRTERREDGGADRGEDLPQVPDLLRDLPRLPELLDRLPGGLGDRLPKTQVPAPATPTDILDFLMAP